MSTEKEHGITRLIDMAWNLMLVGLSLWLTQCHLPDYQGTKDRVKYLEQRVSELEKKNGPRGISP